VTAWRSGTPGEPYSLLEQGDLLVRQGIGLGNDGDQVDLGVKATHHLNIQGLQGVSGGLNEIHTGVHAVVDNVHAVDLVLGLQVGVETLLDVLDDRSPRVIIVDKVTEAGGVHDSQAETNAILFDVRADRLDRHGLGNDFLAGALALLGRIEGGVEECVNQGRFSEAGFTYTETKETTHISERESASDRYGY
jgi:hypothetical protein